MRNIKTKYGIPQNDLDTIVERDADCVYCHKQMLNPWSQMNREDSVTIEHLNHRQDWNSVESYLRDGLSVPTIIAICCGACNSSRGSKSLRDWFKTDYCVGKKLDYVTVSPVVRNYIDLYEK